MSEELFDGPVTEESLKELVDHLKSLALGHTVLYVEDEQDIREEMTELFESVFERVATATNGREGLDLYAREKFSLVITDLNMPEVSGLELIEAVLKTNPKQSIIVTSAHSDAKYLIPLINQGIGSFILKPISLGGVLAAVQKELYHINAVDSESRYQSRLKQEISLRTAELQDSLTEVLKLQMARDQMIALISHELRTPLNGLLGFTDLVRKKITDPESSEYLDMVYNSAVRLERSTRKALDFIRLTTGGKVINKKEFAFKPLIQAAVKEAADRYHLEPAQAVTYHFFQPDTVILVDIELAVEAVRNVVENAFKYALTGGPIRLEYADEDPWVTLVVRDKGPGLPLSVLESGFQPFVSGNLMQHSEGLGLGLALTDVIMLSLGGKIRMDNCAEGGAEVRLSFPKG